MKKFFAVLVALVLVLSMGTVALAADETTPKGTITINNAVKGESYTIYKMFKYEPLAGDTTKGRYIAEDAKWTAFVNNEAKDYLAFDEDAGTIKWVGTLDDEGNPDAEAVSALAKAAVAYAKANDIAGTTKEANSTTVTFDNLALGYYAVDTSLGTICALTTTKTDATVEEKNGQPTVIKKILEDGTPVDANNVAIGDTVNYQATITAGKGTVNYVLHDTMSAGLTFDAGSVVVKKGEATLNAGTDYTLSTPGSCGCTFEIDLSSAYEETLKEGDKIVVTYSATLDSDAVVGNTGNPNEIVLKYGDAQETTKDTVITYTTKLVIDKFEIVEGENVPLKGAGFTLYKKNAENAYEVVGEIAAGETTEFVWTGLSEGDYKLSETTTPAGYNTIKDIEFTITCTEPTEVTSATDVAAWESSKPTEIILQDDGTFKGEIENKTGSLLPETGGIGTTIFYVVGLALMLGAAILLITKKRMTAKAE